MTTKKQERIDKLLIVRAAKDPGPEGEVAKAMLAKRRADREVDPNAPDEAKLEQIASAIRAEWGKNIESQFEVGRLLHEARVLFDSAPRGRHPESEGAGRGSTKPDTLYGQWVRAQGFPFGKNTAYRLRVGYERSDEVRALIALRDRDRSSQDIGVTRAVELLLAKPKPGIPTAEEKAAALAAAEAKDAEGTPAFVAFRKAASALDVTQLPADELAELAGIIKELAAAYNAERTRR